MFIGKRPKRTASLRSSEICLSETQTRENLMSKGLKIVPIILGAYVTIALLHVWLNIGFRNLGLAGGHKAETFRVGFLPVT
jgi:hypothetical protein